MVHAKPNLFLTIIMHSCDGRTAYSIRYSEAIERKYVEEGLSDNPYLSNK